MAESPLHWQHTLAWSLVGSAGVAVALGTAPHGSAREIISCGAHLLAPLFLCVCILLAFRNIPRRRDRLAWLFIGAATGVQVVASAVCLVALARGLALPHVWQDAVLLPVMALICLGLLTRSGKFPKEWTGRFALLFDISTVAVAAVIIAYHLAFFDLVTASNLLGARLLGMATPVIVLGALISLVLMLQRAIPRILHGPRGTLVFGILALLLADVVYVLLRLREQYPGAHPLDALWVLGFGLLGAAVLWEARQYRAFAVSLRAADPFPSALGLLIPLALILLAGILTAVGVLTPLPKAGGYLHFSISSLLLLIALALGRQLMTFLSHRVLYLEMQHLYADMARNAATDPLTGLANHRYYMKRLEREMRRAQRYGRPLALIFADIDHFKQINDVHGHRVGDLALLEVAGALKASIREFDILARYGGEEFVVLLPETQLEQASVLAERLRQAVEALEIPLPRGGVRRVTISCGVAAFPETSDTVESLLSTADHAMYQSKHDGRNRVTVARWRSGVGGSAAP